MFKIKLISIVIPYKIENDKFRVWMQTRKGSISTDELSGLLEFPGGKIEAGESVKQAAIRETLEETAVILDPEMLEKYRIFNWPLEASTLMLNIFMYADNKNQFEPSGWVDLANTEDLEILRGKIPETNHNFLGELLLHNNFE